MRLGLKLKKVHQILEFNQSQSLKLYVKYDTQKRIEAGKNNAKDGKALCKLMNNAVHSKTMEKVRKGINVKLVRNEKTI